MRGRIRRATRVPPPPRTGDAPRPGPEVTALAPAPPADLPATPVEASTTPGPRRPRVGSGVRLEVGESAVNLAIRVRRPLDDHLVELLHRLRRAGVRSSKVELIEMLLWELPADEASVRARLAAFRRAAPRRGDDVPA